MFHGITDDAELERALPPTSPPAVSSSARQKNSRMRARHLDYIHNQDQRGYDAGTAAYTAAGTERSEEAGVLHVGASE